MPGLIRGVARTAVFAGTAAAVSGRVHRRQQQRWAQQAQAAAPPQVYAVPAPQYPAPPDATSAPDAAGPDHLYDQLERLGQLRSDGVLTEEEFEEQKARLLAP